ncbi:MAG: hypothetical protein QOF89_1240 [Acidobacteriota bacterium]|jgi:hypothetical protein|nr:hypothetical protein [Acidobacteriota bacterium]
MRVEKKKKHPQYIPGAADDGFGFFPVITCQMATRQMAGSGASEVLWIVHHRRRQLSTKQEALAAAEAELALAFAEPSLPASPGRFLDHLLRRGFSELTEYRVAGSFDDDRRSVLGDEFQPAFGEEAARNDPILHAAVLRMVDQQIADRDPPETRETVERLLAAGYSPEHVRRMIGFLIVCELTDGMLHQTPFDTKRFVENLRRLPEMPMGSGSST